GLMVVYGVVLIAVVLIGLPETNIHRSGRFRPARLFANYRALLGDWRFMQPTLVVGFSAGTFYTTAVILPFVMIDEVGLTPTGFGYSMLFQSGSFFACSLITARLLRSVPAGRLVPLGLALVLVGASAMSATSLFLTPSVLGVMLPVAVCAGGMAFVLPALTTASIAHFPTMAGAASALMGCIQIGGGMVGSGIASMIGDPL